MDITLLLSFLAFVAMVASWAMLPSGERAASAPAPSSTSVPSTARA